MHTGKINLQMIKEGNLVKRKTLISLAIVISMVIALFVPISAANEDSVEYKAEVLSKLGILRGSPEGQLLRSEATAFLVRMMGKESIIGSYITNRFPDVDPSEWYAPYIGYCTSIGIITGFEDGTFRPKDNISEKQFLKMALVCLGYTYGEDFDWTNVYRTAYEAGLVDDISYATKTADNNKYERAEVIKVIYNALKIENKKTKIKTIQMLINENAVDKDLAVSLGLLTDTVSTAIESIAATDSYSVKVLFNEEIKEIRERDILIFEKNNAANRLEITGITINGKELLISTSAQTKDLEYTIALDNVVDIENNRSNTLSGSFTGFRSPELKSDFFRISKVEPVSRDVVNLYFTHPLTDNSAIPTYYKIYKGDALFADGSAKVLTVKRLAAANNAVSVKLNGLVFNEGEKYTISVSGDFTSLYTVKLNDGKGESISFTGKSADSESLEIKAIVPMSSTTLEVVFNREVDPVFSQKFLNYSVIRPDDSVIDVNKAVLVTTGDKAGKAVRLTLTASLESTKYYKLKIEYLPDVYRESALESYTCNFYGAYSTNQSDLKVTFASASDRSTVYVYFDRPLNPQTATINVYYYIYGLNLSYVATPVKVAYEEKSGYYISKLYLPNDYQLVQSGKYNVIVLSSMQDVNGNISAKDAEYTFYGTSAETPSPQITDATIISNDTIRITFNRDMTLGNQNILTGNYTLVYKIGELTVNKQPISVIPVNTTTFVLKFDTLQYDMSYNLQYTSLEDITGRKGANNTITVKVGK